jgi:hypothetical protein
LDLAMALVAGLLVLCWPWEVVLVGVRRRKRWQVGVGLRLLWGRSRVLVAYRGWPGPSAAGRNGGPGRRRRGPELKRAAAVAAWTLWQRGRGRRLKMHVCVGTGEGAATARLIGAIAAAMGALAASGVSLRVRLSPHWQRPALEGAAQLRFRTTLGDAAWAAGRAVLSAWRTRRPRRPRHR